MAPQSFPANPSRGHSLPSDPWLSLTDLGRLYGISALQCGRLLADAGLRLGNGQASVRALEEGLACQQPQPSRHPRPFWSHQGCSAVLESHGLVPTARHRLVHQWAELLTALEQGSPSIRMTAEEMAQDLPRDLVEPVNRELRRLGSGFQVQPPTAGGRHHKGPWPRPERPQN